MSTTTTTAEQDALRVANRYASLIEKASTLRTRAQACLDAASQYRADARDNQESAENHRTAARTIRDPHVAHQHTASALDAEAEAAREILAARYYEIQAKQYGSAHHGPPAREASMSTDSPATGATTAQPVPDKLRLAGRMNVQPGEHVAGSGSLDAPDGMVLAVAVASPDGPRVHLGLNIGDADSTRWRGADKGATLVLDPAAARHLQDATDQMAAAEQAGRNRDRELRAAAGATQKERARLLKKRFGDHGQAIGDLLDRIDTCQYNLNLNSRHLNYFPTALTPDERAAYEAIDRQIAAEVAAMPLDTDLDTPQDINRHRINELRTQQKAILAGLTCDELRTLHELEEKHLKKRTRDEQDLLDRLHHAPGGVQERAVYGEGKDIGSFAGYARMIDDQVIQIALGRRSINQLRSRSAPNPDPGLDVAVAAADAAFQQASKDLYAYRDETELGAGEIPAGWGALAWSTVIDEDGLIRHHLWRRPPDTDTDDEPGADPVRLTLGGVRKIATLVTNLLAAGANRTAGTRVGSGDPGLPRSTRG